MATLLANNAILTIYGDDRVSALKLDGPQVFHLKNSTSRHNQKTQSSQDPYLGLVRYCAALSNDGKWYAITEDRSLVIWSTSDWSLRSTKLLERSASKIVFSPSNDKILVADKTGDVYMFSVSDDATEKGTLLLGHLSILLDVCMTDDEKYIITCDRDEKIRVTCYPNTYNIKSFCLGHIGFVTRIIILRNDILLSSSGDGSFKLWDFQRGECLGTHFVNEDLKNVHQCIITNVSTMNTVHGTIICTTIHKFNGILIYKCDSALRITLLQQLLCNEPLDVTVCDTIMWVLHCSKDTPLQAFALFKRYPFTKLFCTFVPYKCL